MKKIYLLIFIFVILFTSFLLTIYLPKDYSLNYKIAEIKITESYLSDLKMYKFIIKHNNLDFPLLIDSKYLNKRKLINKIDILDLDKEVCLSIHVAEKLYPICYEESNLKDFRLMSEAVIENYQTLLKKNNKNIIKSYKNINIYNYYNKKYFIWNYKGYDYLNENKNTTIELLNYDEYNNLLTYNDDKYIITPNYDEEYYFTNMFVINTQSLELSKIDLDKEISYNSYYLGDHNRNVYLVDKKHKIQYKININKEVTKIIGTEKKSGIIYINNKWENISLNKLINKEQYFSKQITYNYVVLNDKLYLNIDNNLILISNKKIKNIVKTNRDEVFYLVDNALYLYTPLTGEVKMLENNEWNFNFDKKIFIFD
ncbi:MAG: hypothetical protein PHF21_05380 [Bacilli bacterium]|nr:hypothetical protein [Bacilli bacterium]